MAAMLPCSSSYLQKEEFFPLGVACRPVGPTPAAPSSTGAGLSFPRTRFSSRPNSNWTCHWVHLRPSPLKHPRKDQPHASGTPPTPPP